MKIPFEKSTSVLGDCLDVLRQMPDGCMDLCVTDPPYNMSKKKGLSWAFSKHVTMQEQWDQFTDDEYFAFCAKWIGEVCRVVKPNGNLLVFGSFHNIYLLGFILQKMDLKFLNSIIWIKPNAQPNITCRMLTESSEQILWVCNNVRKKATNWTFDYPEAKRLNDGKQMRNVWSFPVTSKNERVASHPSQKPMALLERLLRITSKPGDWVLDPFGGSGTTGFAAAKLGRHFVQIESNPKYFEAQEERFKKAKLEDQVQFAKAEALFKSAAPDIEYPDGRPKPALRG